VTLSDSRDVMEKNAAEFERIACEVLDLCYASQPNLVDELLFSPPPFSSMDDANETNVLSVGISKNFFPELR
jgi:hypothetical protein